MLAPGLEDILTEGVSAGLMVIASGAEVTEAGTAQFAVEFIVTLTKSPLARVLLVKLDPLAPVMFVPLTCH